MRIIHSLLAVGTAALLLSGCSLFQKNVKTETPLPTDRHTVAEESSATYRNPSLDGGALAGDWLIVSVLGKEATGQDTPYLKFDPESKMLYGSNGCNTINANYLNNPADSTLSFSNMLTTMRACPGDGYTEQAVNTALSMAARYTWRLKDEMYEMTIYDAAMQPLMHLTRQNFDFLNGTWLVQQIDGNKVSNKEMQLVFDMSEMKVHGNTGCNVLNGSLVPDMAVPGSISFQNMSTTRMACPDLNLETALLVALESAALVHPVDKNTVELLNAHNVPVLRLVRE